MRSVLLIKTSSLGDVIHNLPVVSDLRSMWPDLAIDWVVEESFADVPRLHPGVRTVIPVAIRRWRKHLFHAGTWRQLREFTQTLRTERYDLVIDTQGLVKSAVVAGLAHGVRCGYAREVVREPLAALAYRRHYAIAREAHAVVRNRQLVASACGYDLSMPLAYGLISNTAAPTWVPIEPFAMLLTATSRDDKRWHDDEWIALGKALAERGVLSVLPSGTERERERATHIAAAVPGAVIAPRERIAALAAAMPRARCVVGVDTGLTHLAVALGRPTAAVFVASDPGLTGVYAEADAFNLGAAGLPPTAREVLACMEPYLT